MLFVRCASFILIGCFCLFSNPAKAQNVSVKFQVDMTGLTVSPTGVHIAGNFQSEAGFGSDWNPDTTRMTDSNNDQIFEVTVNIPAGTYLYKYINGNSWTFAENAPGECTVGGTNDRQVTIGPAGRVIQPVRFDECPPVVEFSVNMNGWPVSPNGVHVVGDFQEIAGLGSNWNPASIQLLDANNDGYYEARVPLPFGTYKYLFVNGNQIVGVEAPPVDCTVPDGLSTRKRSLILNNSGTNKLWDCFSACGTCIAPDTVSGVQGPWNDEVYYEIFVRSFYDSNNDGIGDFKGIIQKLDYLNDGNPATTSDLGVKGIWLMPMMKSPSYHGYDVTDYYATEPDYGTMADFEALVDSAHKRGIKVILDLVINHTSSQHPWFTQSAANQNGYRDWYVWRSTNPGFNGPWNQQVWHNRNGSFYYGLFYNGMPDLNFNHPPVKQEILNISNFWLAKGVDGFRLDAIQYLVENGTQLAGTQGTFDFLTQFNQSYKAANPQAFTIGEVWDATSVVVPYVQPQKLDACFEFDLAGKILNGVLNGNPSEIRSQLETMK